MILNPFLLHVLVHFARVLFTQNPLKDFHAEIPKHNALDQGGDEARDPTS
jgi:hypothetical protein